MIIIFIIGSIIIIIIIINYYYHHHCYYHYNYYHWIIYDELYDVFLKCCVFLFVFVLLLLLCVFTDSFLRLGPAKPLARRGRPPDALGVQRAACNEQLSVVLGGYCSYVCSS